MFETYSSIKVRPCTLHILPFILPSTRWYSVDSFISYLFILPSTRWYSVDSMIITSDFDTIFTIRSLVLNQKQFGVDALVTMFNSRKSLLQRGMGVTTLVTRGFDHKTRTVRANMFGIRYSKARKRHLKPPYKHVQGLLFH